jgi:hypothetical protein
MSLYGAKLSAQEGNHDPVTEGTANNRSSPDVHLTKHSIPVPPGAGRRGEEMSESVESLNQRDNGLKIMGYLRKHEWNTKSDIASELGIEEVDFELALQHPVCAGRVRTGVRSDSYGQIVIWL